MIAFGGGRRTLAPHVLSSSDLELSPIMSFIYRALFLPPGLHHCFQEMAYPPSQLVLLGIRGAKRASHAQGRVTLERSKNSLFRLFFGVSTRKIERKRRKEREKRKEEEREKIRKKEERGKKKEEKKEENLEL